MAYSESVEVKLARVDERMITVLAELLEAKNGRKSQYDAIEALRLAFEGLANRVGNVEDKFATAQPTIEEFITIKHKVQGAGALGKWLWLVGGVLLGAIAGSRAAIIHWITSGK